MLDQGDLLLDDLWLMDDEPSIDEPSEVLRAIPGMRKWIDLDRDEQLGLRAILEQPEVLSRTWRRTAQTGPHRAKRHGDALRAA